MPLRCAKLGQILLFVALGSCTDANPEMLDETPKRTSMDTVEPAPQPQATMPVTSSVATTPVAPPVDVTPQILTDTDQSIYTGRGADVLTRNAQGEIFLATTTVQKLTADLSPIWQASLGGKAFSLAALTDGGVIAAGEIQDPDCVGAPKECMRGFITRLDADGKQRWALALDQPNSASRVTGLAANDGLIYAAGQFNGELVIGHEHLATSQGGIDFFTLALEADGSRARWVHTRGSSTDDGDGPVLTAHPEGGVIAAGHMQDALLGFVDAYTADGETRFATEVRGHVSLFQLVVDGRGHIWTSGVIMGPVEFGDAQHRLTTRSQFDCFALELAGNGALGSLLQLSSPTDGGARALGLAPRDAGVWFINDYGYHQLHVETKQVVVRFAVIDGLGKYTELDSMELLSMSSRQAAITAADGALLWTSYASQPTTFGLDQGIVAANHFLMRRVFAGVE